MVYTIVLVLHVDHFVLDSMRLYPLYILRSRRCSIECDILSLAAVPKQRPEERYMRHQEL